MTAPPARRAVTGIVVAQLPRALFRVRVDGEQGEIVAHPTGELRRNFIRLLVGDRVRIERSPTDVTRGRIVARCG